MDKVLVLGTRDCGFKSRPGDAGSNPVAVTPFYSTSQSLQGGWPQQTLAGDGIQVHDRMNLFIFGVLGTRKKRYKKKIFRCLQSEID